MEMSTAMGCTLARENENSLRYCQLRGLICPTQKNFSKEEMTIDCCCQGSHLCNHDMNSYRAFYLLPQYMENPLCAQMSAFRFVFLSGEQKYCAVHYDFVLGKVVNLQVNVNMDLLRKEDYNAYEKLGCQFIEAKIRVNIPVHCEDQIYKREDTLMGRLIYMCTCSGKSLSERMNESACDVELEKEIAKKARAVTQRYKLPSCYHINLITDAVNSAPADISKFLSNNITKPSGIK
uniref:Protein sleepless n=1 Tax=Elaeophora elaphi TaxID=1147741 RepID=A0A0R3S5K3_9BILA